MGWIEVEIHSFTFEQNAEAKQGRLNSWKCPKILTLQSWSLNWVALFKLVFVFLE